MQNQTLIIVAVVLFVVAALLGTAIVAVMFLTGGQSYDVPVASRSISANTQINPPFLSTKTLQEQPDDDVIQSTDQITGKITTRNISSGSTFTADDVRDQFELAFTTQSIPAGTRIQQSMLQVRDGDEKPSGAITDPNTVVGKMVRESLPANQPIQRQDIYMQEQKYVVVTEPIKANSMVRESQLKVVSRPQGPGDGVSSVSAVTGKPIKRSLQPGDVIRQSDLYSGEPQLSYFIPMYKRAVSIPVANHNSYSFMMKPGDLVDIYAYAPRSFDVTGSDGNQEEQTVHTLQKISDAATVLSLNDKFTKQQIKNYETAGGTGSQVQRNFTYQSMTFGVSLKESERLSLVRGMKNSGVNINYFAVLRPKILKSDYGINRDITDFELFNPTSEGRNERLQGSKSVEVIHGNAKEVYRVPSQ